MKAKFVNEAMGDVLKGKSDEEIMSSLENTNLDINDLLINTARVGFLSGVKKALKMGANVHVYNDAALRNASENGHLNVVELLFKYGADVHANNDDALWWASQNSHLDVVKLLKKYM
jgi:ankyrin repeat protein